MSGARVKESALKNLKRGNYTFTDDRQISSYPDSLVDKVHEEFDYKFDRTLSIAKNAMMEATYGGSGKTTGSAHGGNTSVDHRFVSDQTPEFTYDGYSYEFKGNGQNQLSTQQYSTSASGGLEITPSASLGHNTAPWTHLEGFINTTTSPAKDVVTSADGATATGTSPAFYSPTIAQQTPGLANFPFRNETSGQIANNPQLGNGAPATNAIGGSLIGVPVSTDLVEVTNNGQRGFMRNGPNGLTDFQPLNVNPTTQEVSVLGAGLQGAARGVGNSVRGALNAVGELGLQALDFVNATAEVATGNALWKGDLSQTANALNSGQLSMGQYFTDLGLNTATFGVYGEAKAFADYQAGKISADQASEIIGGAAIQQLVGAKLMSKAQAEARASVAEACEEPGACFPAGTLVSTQDGRTPIEQVTAGERVWGCNLVTGQWELHAVLEPYHVEYEGQLVTIGISGDRAARSMEAIEGNDFVGIGAPLPGDEIIQSTVAHPFWVMEGEDLDDRPLPESVGRLANDGDEPDADFLQAAQVQLGAARLQGAKVPGRWVDSHELRPGDLLLLQDGREMRVQSVSLRHWTGTVYNLAVEDLHCYAVGEHGVLAHNACGAKGLDAARKEAVRKAWQQEQDLAKRGLDTTRDWTPAELRELIKNGKVKGYEGHHINSVNGHPELAGNPNNVEFVTRAENLARHNGNWRNQTTGPLLNRVPD